MTHEYGMSNFSAMRGASCRDWPHNNIIHLLVNWLTVFVVHLRKRFGVCTRHRKNDFVIYLVVRGDTFRKLCTVPTNAMMLNVVRWWWWWLLLLWWCTSASCTQNLAWVATSDCSNGMSAVDGFLMIQTHCIYAWSICLCMWVLVTVCDEICIPQCLWRVISSYNAS